MGIRKPEQPKIIWLISWWNGNWSLYVPLCLWFCYSHLTCVKFIPLPLCRLHVDKEDHREPSKWGGKRHGGEKKQQKKQNKETYFLSHFNLGWAIRYHAFFPLVSTSLDRCKGEIHGNMGDFTFLCSSCVWILPPPSISKRTLLNKATAYCCS